MKKTHLVRAGRFTRWRTGILASLSGLALLSGGQLVRPAQAASVYTVNVILPLTGNFAFLGQGEKKALEAQEAWVNQNGGIHGDKLAWKFYDDQSTPQVSLQLTNNLLPSHPAVILGSTIVAMCQAMAPMFTAKGPVQYCFSPGIHPKHGSHTYSSGASTNTLLRVIMHYIAQRGWTRVATITSSDASGQDGDRAIAAAMAQPGNKALKLVSQQHFTIGDVSVAAQIERIKEAKPQVLIAWSTGAPIATVFKGITQTGLNVPVVTTNGNQTNAQMDKFASFIPKQLFIPTSVFPEHEGLYKLDPRVEKAQHEFYKVMTAAHVAIDNQSSLAWDPGLVVVHLLRKLGLKATGPQMQAALANTTSFAGINGLYNYKKYPQRGLGGNDGVVVVWNAATQTWVPVSNVGGTPLKK